MRSNIECWKALHEAGYFENHRCYRGLHDEGNDVERIESFVALKPDDVVAVIGCGYGRECVQIAGRVAAIYGIDVSGTILDKAAHYLEAKGIKNFVPVLTDNYVGEIPDAIDVVYSVCVMQHLSRDLVRRYLSDLGRKLRGSMVIQFLDQIGTEGDASMQIYEPSVSWTPAQIAAAAHAAGLRVAELRTEEIRQDCLWHWVHLKL